MKITHFVMTTLVFFVGAMPIQAETDTVALKWLYSKVEKPRIKKDRSSGMITEIAVNAPDFRNEDLVRFNEFKHLKKLTISHAGYASGKKTGVDFSGVAHLKDHPTLTYFSAGGAVGKEYLVAVSKLTNISELYIQTTHTVDQDWAPIGKMTQLRFLGIRVRNDRMSNLSDAFFKHLKGLKNLERMLVSEMMFEDPTEFHVLISSLPKLRELEIRRSNLSTDNVTKLRQAHPKLRVTISD